MAKQLALTLPFPFILALPLAVCCSVLEDRNECPCFLSLDLSDEGNAHCDSITVNLCGGDYDRKVTLGREDFSVPLTLTVPRGEVSVNAFDSTLDSLSGSSGLVIPLGEQCPAVYMFSRSCDTSSEEALCHIRVRKNYCGVSLSFASKNPDRFRLDIEGDVCGYTREGQPLEGEFDYEPDFSREGNCFFRLPRQGGQPLYLRITSTQNGAFRRLSLGSYILQSGYDWTKEDLDDITVSINYADLELRISVNGWTTVVEKDIVI